MKDPKNTLLSKMDQAISDHCKEIVSKRDSMIIDRLEEMGYDITDKKAIAKRCELKIFVDNEVREIWIDSGTPDQKLVCYFTDPEPILHPNIPYRVTGTEFKFAPMPESK